MKFYLIRFPTVAFALLLALVPVSLSAQTEWELPRTASGAPDLQGIWTSATITTLESNPAVSEQMVVSAEEAARIERTAAFNVLSEADNAPSDPGRAPPTDGDTDAGYNAFWIDPGSRLAVVNGEYRTFFIVDPPNGRIPYTAAGGQAFMQTARSLGFDGPEKRPLGERCMVGFGSTGGPPMLPVLYNNNYQIVQNDSYVMILVEMNHDARIIRLNKDHLTTGFKPWLGDSVGYFDGDTLVVETVNFHPQQSFRAAIKHQFYLPPTAKVTERFTRTGPDEMLYEFTVEDEETYSQPWSAQIPFRTAEGQMYEYACHEGNYALPGILAGARQSELDSGN
jgi:hypothetical protein